MSVKKICRDFITIMGREFWLISSTKDSKLIIIELHKLGICLITQGRLR